MTDSAIEICRCRWGKVCSSAFASVLCWFPVLSSAQVAPEEDARDPKKILEFRMVRDTPSAETEQMILLAQGKEETLHVGKKVLLDGALVASARVRRNEFGGNAIHIRFTAEGTRRFANVTRDALGKRLAIIVNGRIVMAPVVREAIAGGKVTISGTFSADEARRIARDLTPE
jgi:preprotein translocase subunit SecD